MFYTYFCFSQCSFHFTNLQIHFNVSKYKQQSQGLLKVCWCRYRWFYSCQPSLRMENCSVFDEDMAYHRVFPKFFNCIECNFDAKSRSFPESLPCMKLEAIPLPAHSQLLHAGLGLTTVGYELASHHCPFQLSLLNSFV